MFKRIYQYVSLSNERETIQKIIDKAYGNIILDLEDTVEDKKQAIHTLGKLTNNPNINIHVRIHDKTNLDYLSKITLDIKEIFVPKVTSHFEIRNLKEQYSTYSYITMIEDEYTKELIENCLVYSDGIHFGYYDYCLSNNIFPINFDYWFNVIQEELYKECEKKGKKFISSPVKDTDILYKNFKQRELFFVSIVRYSQLNNLIPDYWYALDIIKKYELKNDIFNKYDIDSYITPHEYKLAKKYVENFHK